MAPRTKTVPKLHRPATFDHLRKKEPLEKTIEVALSDSAFQRVQDLEAELFTTVDEAAKKKIQKELDLANAELDESTVELKFRSLGRKAYEDLLEQHPPEEEDEDDEEVKKDEQIWNAKTFPKALVAASLVEPKLSDEEIDILWDEWNGNEVTALFWAALEVNTSRRLVK